MDEMKNDCYIYILDGLSDWEISYIITELKSKRYLSKNINMKYIAKNLNPIKTMGGCIIEPDHEISKIEFKAGDLLILPGSDKWDRNKDEELIKIIKNFENNEIIIAAICGATIFLSQLDILNNRNHTSNDLHYLKMINPNYKGESFYTNKNVVVTENLITATGIAPLEFSYEVFKKLNIMKEKTLENWYNLYNSKDSKYFLPLMNSL